MMPFGFMPNEGMPMISTQFFYGFPFLGFLGRGRGGPNGGKGRNQKNNGRHVSQFCGKQGHIVNRSWYRFNPNFQANTNLMLSYMEYGDSSTSQKKSQSSSS